MEIKRADVERMFKHYIERKRYNQSKDSCSQDGLYSAGECSEAEKWLKLCGVDLSYERIQEMVEGKREIRAFDVP